MRRILTLLVAATTAALSVVGCGSDGDSSPTGAAGASSATQCVGIYADKSASAFADALDATKACADDAATLCSNDMVSIVGTCGKTCALQAAQTEAAQAECNASCIAEKIPSTSKALSEACVGCYTNDVGCARVKCFTECLTPASEACAVCRVENGCASAFYQCSGLPSPTGSSPGAGGEGGS